MANSLARGAGRILEYFDFFVLATAALESARERLASTDAFVGLKGGDGGARDRVRRAEFSEVNDLKGVRPLREPLAGLDGEASGDIGERGR